MDTATLLRFYEDGDGDGIGFEDPVLQNDPEPATLMNLYTMLGMVQARILNTMEQLDDREEP